MTQKDSAPAITAREVYQVLKDAAMGTRALRVVRDDTDHRTVDIDGWQLRLFIQDACLRHCEECTAADGRVATLDAWQRYGTDPVALLSGWEHQQLERLLALNVRHLGP